VLRGAVEWLSSAVLIVPNTEVPHAVQVVRQHVAVTGSQPVTLNYSLQKGYHLIERAFVVVPPRQFPLKLVQLPLSSIQSRAISGERKRTGCRVIKIFSDALEEHGSASIAPERIIAGSMIGVRVLTMPTLLTAVVLVRTVALEATITLVHTVAFIWTVSLRSAITLRATIIAGSYKAAILTCRTVGPGQSEGIVPCTAPGIFNFDDSGNAISRLRNEVLTTTSADNRKLEVWRNWRHWRCTLEASPFWSSTPEVS